MTDHKRYNRFASNDADRFQEPSDSLRDTTADMYGEPKRVDTIKVHTGRQVVMPMSIYEILPDMMQPRRGMPSVVRSAWDGNAQTILSALESWWNIANQESGLAIDLHKIIANEHDAMPDIPEEVGSPITRSFLELAGLAANIFASGLTNAITVIDRPTGIKQIETGERRWLAFHLIYGVTGDEKWTKIPARLVDAFNVWRQASENNARSPLNAIGKARQFALLLMELLGRENFKPFDAFEHDQEFYAQVANGEVYRVPRGKGDLILNAMGLQNPVQIRQYRTLLRLQNALWVRADDENWTENQLRDYTVTPVTVSGAKTGSQTLKPVQLVLPGFANPEKLRDFKNHFERLQNYHKGMLALDAEQIATELDKLRRWIQEQEEELSKAK